MADSHQTKQNETKKTSAPVQRLEDDHQQVQQQLIPDMGGLLQRMHTAPSSLAPRHVLQLQRVVGNQAMGQVLGRGKSVQHLNIDGAIQRKPMSIPWHPTRPAVSGPLVQPSLEPKFAGFMQRKPGSESPPNGVPLIQRDGLHREASPLGRVGPANDKYEEEADKTADEIMRMPRSPVTVHRKPINQISRYKTNRITTSKQTRNVIQPARGKWGRFLGSLGTLPLPGIGDLSARLTFGFEKGRKKITKPNHTSNRYIIQNISITSTEIGGNDNFVLRGRKYIPADYSLESGTKKGLTKAIILLSGSGGSNEDQLQPVAKQYTEQGSTVYAVNYRGYGNSKDRKRRRDGTYNESMPYLSEQGLYDDAQRIYDYVRRDGFNSKQIVIHGYSLGGAVAAHLAKKVAKTEQLGGLVLHSSIRSSYKAARGGLGWLKYFGLAQLGGLYTKMSAGSFGTVSHLKKLAERDSNIPIHFMSGSKDQGDQLSLGETELDEEAGKMGFQNLTSHEGPGSHLRTSDHLDHPTWNALGDLLSVQRKAQDETSIRQTNQLHTLQRDGGDGSFDTSDEFTNKVNSSKGGGRPLPQTIQADFGSKIGADLSGVRVHTGGESAKLNQQIQAKAFTHGNDIHFGSGQYNPSSSEGKRLIAHEVTHTVQQGASPVQRKANEKPLLTPQTELSSTIQPYRQIDNTGYNLIADTETDARAPFTRFEDTLTIQAPQSGKSTKGMGWKKHLDHLPPLKVANDNTLAINATAGEPKEFYANSQVITNANRDLKIVGSPITLHAAGNKITLPKLSSGDDEDVTDERDELVMVQPRHKMKDVPGKDEFVNLVHHVCRDITKEIMGGMSHTVLKDDDEKKSAPLQATSPTVISGLHTLAQELTLGDVSTDEAIESITTKDEDDPPKVGETYGKGTRSTGDINDRAESLGINKHAWAKVGQGYVTQSISDETGSKTDYSKVNEPENPFVWGYHFTAIVAESLAGTDQIALENYNRYTSEMITARAELLRQLKEDFATEIDVTGIQLTGTDAKQIGSIIKLLEKGIKDTTRTAEAEYRDMIQRYIGKMGSHWYFRIIGQGLNQSFHEQMAASSYFVNPMTVVVSNRKIATPKITFASGTITLDTTAEDEIAKVSKQILSAVYQGIAPTRIHLTGHDNSWYGSEEVGKNRADAVKTEFTGNNINGDLFTTTGKGVWSSDPDDHKVTMVIEE